MVRSLLVFPFYRERVRGDAPMGIFYQPAGKSLWPQSLPASPAREHDAATRAAITSFLVPPHPRRRAPQLSFTRVCGGRSRTCWRPPQCHRTSSTGRLPLLSVSRQLLDGPHLDPAHPGHSPPPPPAQPLRLFILAAISLTVCLSLHRACSSGRKPFVTSPQALCF